jgi:uncharacterized protein
MTFEWDPKKNELNIEKHGVNFADAEQVFRSPMIVHGDFRKRYGELRYIGLGLLNRRVIAVAFTLRNPDVVRVISMRRANRREAKQYEKEIKNRLGAS